MMTLKNVAILTGLSLAGVLSSGFLLPAQAISLNAWSSNPIVSGDTTFTLNSYSTTGTGTSSSVWSQYESFLTNAGQVYGLNIGVGLGGILAGAFGNTGTYTINYTVEVTSGSDLINLIALGINPTGLTATKQAWTDGFGGTNLVANLSANNSTPTVSTSVIPNVNKLYVTDIFTLGSGPSDFFSSGTNLITQVAPTPVPWETDIFPLVGAVTFLGAGVLVKKKLAQAKNGKVNLED